MMKDIVTHTIVFLRMTAVELRRLADREPNTSDELRHTADQCLKQAEELSYVSGAATAGDGNRSGGDDPRRAADN
jgi:hypothetical protein